MRTNHPAPPPHQPRPLTQLSAILDRAAGRPGTTPVVTITGTGGVGKTALAVHWAHRVRDWFPDGQLYVNLRGFCPSGAVVTPADALRGFLDGLGVPHARIPATVDARTALFRSLVAGRRYLILLDNARDAEQVRPLLPGSSDSIVVITSRDLLPGLVAVEGAHPVPLDLLSTEEAEELLGTRIGHGRATSDPTALAAITEATARLPLALAVVAARASLQPDLTMTALAVELRHAQGLDAFAGHDARSDLRAVLSWSYKVLSGEAARLFRLLAIHPGPTITPAAASSLSGLPPRQTRALIAELTQAQLIDESGPGRYAFHDLLRAYAAELADEVEPATDRSGAVARLVDHYLHSARTGALRMNPQLEPFDAPPLTSPRVRPEAMADLAAAREWFTAEHAVLLAVVRQAAACELHLSVWHLAYSAKTFLFWSGHWGDLAETQTLALEAAHRLGDLAAQAHAHRSLGKALHLAQGEDARAETDQHLKDALDLFAALDHTVGQAETHVDLAAVFEWRDRPEDALHHNRQALDLFRAVGSKLGEARALNNVSYFHGLLGDHAQALDMCAKSIALLEELGDRRGQALAWGTLGSIHQDMGRHADAADCYERSAEGCREVGDASNEADSLTHLGENHLAVGDPQAARQAWLRALELLDGLDHPDAETVRARRP
ncbi:tetratricopeptide repeat protein [Streptomyces sp. NPDC056367]|uniref:tetratricopeptide repeat protein n=1 Tax=Streptomyces sp. NPDC056367 TaxID=3345797 RepID=UPI0035DD5CAE